MFKIRYHLWILFLIALIISLGLALKPAHSAEIGLQIVSRAIQEIGKGETTSNNCGEDIKKYMQGKEKLSWCAGFVSYLLYENTYTMLGYNHSAKQIWNKGRKLGLEVKEPQAGDLVCFWRISPKAWQGHIGIVEQVDEGTIIVIEGNKGKFPAKVKRVIYHKNKIPKLLGYLRLKGGK